MFAAISSHRLAATLALPWLLLAAAGYSQAQAQDNTKPVYRCPGPPVLYTDAITAQEARDKACRTIEGASVTIVQTPRPRVAGPGLLGSTVSAGNSGNNSAAGSGPTATPAPVRTGEARVDPAAQRARDTDARRILNEELRTEEERLAALQREFNNGEPERRGDERNFQRYVERVAEMRAGIARKEADIAALKRELSKLPQ